MNPSKTIKILTRIAYCSLAAGMAYIIIAVGVICFSHPGIFSSWVNFNNSFSRTLTANIGDYLWDCVGAIFTFTATIFLFITLKEQREQLQLTRKDSEKVRFETTYFNILAMLKQVQDTVNANIATKMCTHNCHSIIDYYQCFAVFYRTQLKSDSGLRNLVDTYDPIAASIAQTDQYRGAISTVYENFIADTGCNIGYLYRYIYNTLRFVIDNPDNQVHHDARDRYLNLLQAQLSNEELCLIFYNAISSYGKNSDGRHHFNRILDETHFLENIDPTFLLNSNQYTFYPHTHFKFLTRTQHSHISRPID